MAIAAAAIVMLLLQGDMSSSAEDSLQLANNHAVQASKEPAYLACGCGCCGGTEQKTTCVADAQALHAKATQDKQQKQNPQCAMMGCSVGVEYRICE